MLDIPLVGRAERVEESLNDVAYRVIADRLIMLEIRPNESINETQLSKEMQMGRTPIREALRRLEGDRLVVSHARKGAYAAPIDFADPEEIAQLRQALEPMAAELAARLASTNARKTFEKYREIIRTLDPAGVEQSDLMRLDLAVHQLVYRAAGNSHLEETLLRYANLWTRILGLMLERRPLILEQLQELGGVVQAILDRDGAEASRLMTAQLNGLNEYLRA
ncbi:GntR family transcriptional regulator [Pseudarthrobacter chlorophenolicus]|uniref:GntR family transcriptional regulator n=1 Tax=Pseudarthrobacter chlorophenolicus TaxID=85085 RepID=UPI000695DB30|nr:GntR family transcriptional regulator [Pseudarthrobacter chlorophenolicus]